MVSGTARGHRSNSLQTTCRRHRRSRCRPSFLLRTSRCSSGTARSNSTIISPSRLSVARSLTHLLDGIWAAISVRGAEVVAEALGWRLVAAKAAALGACGADCLRGSAMWPRRSISRLRKRPAAHSAWQLTASAAIRKRLMRGTAMAKREGGSPASLGQVGQGEVLVRRIWRR